MNSSNQNETPFFSFVVPACDIAPYAETMIRSLQAQTWKDFECLLVCEESKDGTETLLETLSSGDPRFRLIRLPRSGSASESRNYGIRHARGIYLVFVDGDDWIDPESLERFQDKLTHTVPPCPDILCASSIRYTGEGDGPWTEDARYSHPCLPEQQVLSGPQALERLMGENFRTATWNRIYRREFLLSKQLFQVCGRRHQDDEWSYRVFFEAETVAGLDYPWYCYRKRPGSVTTQLNPQSVKDITDNLLSFLDFFKRHERAMSPLLRRNFSNWVCSYPVRYLRQSKYPTDLRFSELHRILGDAETRKIFFRMMRQSRKSQQLLIPFFATARFRLLFPLSEFLFKKIYWPLLMRRSARTEEKASGQTEHSRKKQ